MSFALVDISGKPRIVMVYDTLAEAILDREITYRLTETHVFRTVGRDGIQQLSGYEAQREARARKAILEREAETRKKIAALEKQQLAAKHAAMN